jgi:hypothetical protein
LKESHLDAVKLNCLTSQCFLPTILNILNVLSLTF